MLGYIDNYNFKDMEAERYWTFAKSYKGDAKAETRNMIFSGEYVGSRKVDGYFSRFVKDDEGNTMLLARSKNVKGEYPNKINFVPQLRAFFDSLPNGTCLLGEVFFPNNEGSSNVTKILGCKEEKAVERQIKGDMLHYYIFDIIAYNGESYMNKTVEERISKLAEIFQNYKTKDELLHYVNFATYFEGKELWEALQRILELGGEGVVITKKGTHPEPGKRTARKTLKIKKEISHTIDCFFTGRYTSPTKEYTGKELPTWQYWRNLITGEKFNEKLYKSFMNGAPIEPITKSYFNGWAGSLEIGVFKNGEIKPIGLISGLSDEIKANHEDYKYKTIEVSAMEYLETGGLRHAKMVCFRPDKPYTECNFEQLEEIA